MSQQQVEELDLQQDLSIVIAGSRRSGKSVLLKHLIHYLTNKFDYHYIILFSETGKIQKNNCWDWIDEKYIHETKQIDQVLQQLFQYLYDKQKNKKEIKNGLIILDDIQLDKQYSNLIQLFSTGRHFNICILCSVQYSAGILSPAIRSNIDMLFCSRMNISGLQQAYQTINDFTIEKEYFYDLIQQNYQDHQFVCYDNINKQLCIVQAQMMDLCK